MKHIFHWFTIILHHNISLTRISTHSLPTWMNIYLTKWQCKPQPTSFLRFQDSLSSSYPKHSLETSFFQLDMTSNITWKNWLVSPTIHLKTSFFRGSILVVTNKRTPMIAIVMSHEPKSTCGNRSRWFERSPQSLKPLKAKPVMIRPTASFFITYLALPLQRWKFMVYNIMVYKYSYYTWYSITLPEILWQNWDAGYFLSAMKNHQRSSCDFFASQTSKFGWVAARSSHCLERGNRCKTWEYSTPARYIKYIPPENEGGGTMEKEINIGYASHELNQFL